jgi:hypothetical protein
MFLVLHDAEGLHPKRYDATDSESSTDGKMMGQPTSRNPIVKVVFLFPLWSAGNVRYVALIANPLKPS